MTSKPILKRRSESLRKLDLSLFLALLVLLFLVENVFCAAPRILRQPEPRVARVGGSVSLSVGVEGSEPLDYYWFFERKEIVGASGSTLSFDSVSVANAGLYWVIVSNSWGRVGSDGVVLRVGTAGEWSSSTNGNGHIYEFVQSGPRENDWAKLLNDVADAHGYLVSYTSRAEEKFVNTIARHLTITRLIGLIQPPGSTEPAGGWRWMSGEPLTFTNWAPGEPNDFVSANFRGHENLVGVNSDGRWNDIHGGGFSYIVEYPTQLSIYAQPTNRTVSGYDKTALRAGAASQRPLRFQWFAGGQEISGVNSNVLPVDVALEHSGPYYFTVSDGVATLPSAAAEVKFGPLITESPTNTAVYAGETATFGITATGEEPLRYQWWRNGVTIPGATERVLVLTNLVLKQACSDSKMANFDVIDQ